MRDAHAVPTFYDRHPINEWQVMDLLHQSGKDLTALTPEDLFPLDQDHIGGVAAVNALARSAAIHAGSRVLDVCCGLGGPARYLAYRSGCRVVGIDLTASRCIGAERLTRLVRLDRHVAIVRGNATCLPFRSGAFTACVAEEAFLHIPDRRTLLRECRRVLAPGGRLAFTDWIAGESISQEERTTLAGVLAADQMATVADYRQLLAEAGFREVVVEDLTEGWQRILQDRLANYRSLRPQTVARFGEARYEEYDGMYAYMVALTERGKLGGVRASGTC